MDLLAHEILAHIAYNTEYFTWCAVSDAVAHNSTGFFHCFSIHRLGTSIYLHKKSANMSIFSVMSRSSLVETSSLAMRAESAKADTTFVARGVQPCSLSI